MTHIMDKQNFERFGFKMRFGRIYPILHQALALTGRERLRSFDSITQQQWKR